MSLSYNNSIGEHITVVAMGNLTSPQEALRALQTGQTTLWCLPLAVDILIISIEEDVEVGSILTEFANLIEEPTRLPPK